MSGHEFSWTLSAPPAPPLPPAPVVALSKGSSLEPTFPAFLGSGLVRPFVRDQKNDFANASGIALLKSCVGQILGTRAADESGQHQGEIPWRPDFGSLIFLLQHRHGATLDDLARIYASQGLNLWEPRVINVVATTTFDPSEKELSINLKYDVIAQNRPGNQVLVQGVTQDISIQVSG